MKNIELGNNPYLLVNIIIAGVILMIFIYSGIFSSQKCNYPIHSQILLTENPNLQNPGEGLSRAFSEILRGRLKDAQLYNKESLRLFAFFLVQLLLRLAVSAIIMFSKKLIDMKRIATFDAGASVLLFILAFYNFFGSLIN